MNTRDPNASGGGFVAVAELLAGLAIVLVIVALVVAANLAP